MNFFPSKIRLKLDIRSSLKVVFYSVLDAILRPFPVFGKDGREKVARNLMNCGILEGFSE